LRSNFMMKKAISTSLKEQKITWRNLEKPILPP